MKNISKSHSNKQVEVKCDYCGVNYLKDTKRVNANAKQGLKNYCCYNCQRNSKFSGTTEKCAYCGNDVYRSNAAKSRSSSGRVFCCKSHATSYNNQFKIDEKHPNFKTGEGSYREKALKYYGPKCRVCGYSVESVLEVHHKDGNRRNNKIENLDVLCPTHHKEYGLGIRKY